MKTKLFAFLMLLFIASMVNAQTIYQIGDEITARIEMVVTGEVRTVGFELLYDTAILAYNSNQRYGIFEQEIYNDFGGRGAAGFNMMSNDKPSVTNTTMTILTVKFIAKEKGETEIVFNKGYAGIGEVPANETEWQNGNIKIDEIPINRVAFKIIIE